jgi:autotransporter translocation and assembly factor TamB
VTADWGEPGIAGLAASASLRARDLAVDGRSPGDLELSASAGGGLIRSTGSCCGATFEALCSASEEGLRECTLTVDAEDLSRIGELFDVDGLSGSARVRMVAAGLSDTVSVDFSIDSDRLEFRDFEIAPVHAEGAWRGGAYEGSFALFGSALTGRGRLEESGDYRAEARLDSFDLAAVVGDSLRESMDLKGRADAHLSVTGSLDRGFLAAGELSALMLSVRGQSLDLAAPFDFAFSPDSVSARGFLLDTSFGSLSGSLVYASSGAIEAEATIYDIDLAEVLQLLPEPPENVPSGMVDGSLKISGTWAAPVYTADVTADGLEMRGVALDTVSVYVEGDTTHVVFDLSAASARSGTFWAGGSIPVMRDSSGMFAFDPTREFGASIRGEGFVLDGTEAVLPGVRGEKILVVDGEALLTGRADSLVSINGSGRFDSLRVSLDLVEVVLSDTMLFEVDNGKIALDEVSLGVVRKRVLGGREGGSLTFEGSLDPRGEIDMTAGLAGVDVGHILRAFAGRGVDVRGSLDADVRVSGETRNPEVRFSWEMAAPRFYGFGFDSAVGSGAYAARLLRIERARLAAGGDSISVSGTVATGGGTDESLDADTSATVYDLSLTAESFRLGRLRSVPAGIDRLKGTIDADIAVRGNGEAIDLGGGITLTGGSLEGFGLAEPVRNLSATLQAQGSSIALREAGADLGSGSVELTGLVDLYGPSGQTTFYARARLRSPEIVIEDTFEGKFGGHIEWGGTPDASTLKGEIVMKDAVVTRSVGLADLVGGGPRVIVVRPERDPRADVQLDIGFDIEDALEVDSNVARLSLTGGGLVRGTLLEPRVSGGVEANGGTFTYLDNEFSIETLNVSFPNPNRRDPYVSLTGTSEVEDRSGETYSVTVSVDGYLNDVVPRLTSVPPLSEPDIASLLTFGTTFGGFVTGGPQTDSSGDTFSNLARSAFFSSAFGLAESALERLLNLDRVTFDEGEFETGGLAETGVTIGKEFGDKIQVNYSTSVGRFSGQRIEVSFELTEELSLQTRTDPEGDHAVGVKIEIPFR